MDVLAHVGRDRQRLDLLPQAPGRRAGWRSCAPTPGSVHVAGLVEPGSTTITQVTPRHRGGRARERGAADLGRPRPHDDGGREGRGRRAAPRHPGPPRPHRRPRARTARRRRWPSTASCPRRAPRPCRSSRRGQGRGHADALGPQAEGQAARAPKKGTIGKRSKVTVSWRASDADGGSAADRRSTTRPTPAATGGPCSRTNGGAKTARLSEPLLHRRAQRADPRPGQRRLQRRAPRPPAGCARSGSKPSVRINSPRSPVSGSSATPPCRSRAAPSTTRSARSRARAWSGTPASAGSDPGA